MDSQIDVQNGSPQQVFDEEPLQEFSIADLNNSESKILFLIPGYQRGYRWTTNEHPSNKDSKGRLIRKGEIETLLQDLMEFTKPMDGSCSNNEEFPWNNYCLQPIVLQKTQNRNQYLVVDGQQRLTTLAIISHILLGDGQKWCLSWDIDYQYENRKLSECLLNTDSSSNGKINDYFRNEAVKAVKQWFENDHKDCVSQIRPLFDGSSAKQHILLIKYMLDEKPSESNDGQSKEEPGHATFKRLNSSKIPLTAGELIKAMFMAPNNGLLPNEKMEIAKEWELIESTLHDPEYWNMFSVNGSGLRETQTRIELLFTIVANLNNDEMTQSIHDERLLFRRIEDKTFSADELRSYWSEVLKVYWWIKSCYSNVETYNLLGWLAVFRNNMPQTIYKKYWINDAQRNLDNFNRKLKEQINIFGLINSLFNVSFPDTFSDMDESSFKERIRTLPIYNSNINHRFKEFFVLLNAQACSNNGVRFSYSDFRRISKNGYIPKDGEEIPGWDVEHINPQSSPLPIENRFENDSICNLILLDATTNRKQPYSGYGDYAQKRNYIIKYRLDHPGYFMLPCSQKAILKFYTTKANCADKWNDSDGDAYFEALWKLLKDFLSGIIQIQGA